MATRSVPLECLTTVPILEASASQAPETHTLFAEAVWQDPRLNTLKYLWGIETDAGISCFSGNQVTVRPDIATMLINKQLILRPSEDTKRRMTALQLHNSAVPPDERLSFVSPDVLPPGEYEYTLELAYPFYCYNIGADFDPSSPASANQLARQLTDDLWAYPIPSWTTAASSVGQILNMTVRTSLHPFLVFLFNDYWEFITTPGVPCLPSKYLHSFSTLHQPAPDPGPEPVSPQAQSLDQSVSSAEPPGPMVWEREQTIPTEFTRHQENSFTPVAPFTSSSEATPVDARPATPFISHNSEGPTQANPFLSSGATTPVPVEARPSTPRTGQYFGGFVPLIPQSATVAGSSNQWLPSQQGTPVQSPSSPYTGFQNSRFTQERCPVAPFAHIPSDSEDLEFEPMTEQRRSHILSWVVDTRDDTTTTASSSSSSSSSFSSSSFFYTSGSSSAATSSSSATDPNEFDEDRMRVDAQDWHGHTNPEPIVEDVLHGDSPWHARLATRPEWAWDEDARRGFTGHDWLACILSGQVFVRPSDESEDPDDESEYEETEQTGQDVHMRYEEWHSRDWVSVY